MLVLDLLTVASVFDFCDVQMEHEKKEEAIQREIDRYRGEKTKLETERKMKQDRMVHKQYSFTAVMYFCCFLCLSSPTLLAKALCFFLGGGSCPSATFACLFIILRLSRQILLPRHVMNSLSNFNETYREKPLPLLMTCLDFGGQRSRSLQAVEVAKVSVLMLGCRESIFKLYLVLC